jgi:hypothetical protein
MAIEFFTGFEGCAYTSDLYALMDSISSSRVILSSGDGFDGGKCFQASYDIYGGEQWIGKNCISAKTKAIGAHFGSVGTSTASNKYLMQFRGPNVRLNNTSSGINVYVNGSLLTTVGSKIPTTWTHIEAKLFSDSSVGTLEIKVNGEIICELTNVNTGGQDITSCRWCTSGSYNGKVDNCYLADDFYGEVYSYLLKPSSDSVVDFTPSSGTDNYALLQSDDGDSSYVYSDVENHQDLYEFEDLPSDLIPLALSIVITARKEGSTMRTIQMRSKQDSTEYDEGSEIILGTSYPASVGAGFQSARVTAPDGSFLTREIVNSLKWGFKILEEEVSS